MMKKEKDEMSTNKIPSNIGFIPQRIQQKIIKNNDGTSSNDKNEIENNRKLEIENECRNKTIEDDNLLKEKFPTNNSLQRNLSFEKHEKRNYNNSSTRGILLVQSLSNENSQFKKTNNTFPNWFNTLLGTSSSTYNLVRNIKELHLQISVMIRGNQFLENWQKFRLIKKELQDCFVKLLSKDLKFCCKENVEQYFWKILYYNFIEILKKLLDTSHDNDLINIKLKTLEHIEEGTEFYTKTLKILENDFNFCIETYLSKTIDTIENRPKFESLLLVIAQKFLINLGDLSRYKEQILKTQKFDTTIEYYEKAQILLPTNGIPYNKMSIVALYLRKHFDAVYYHVRSLLASNPIVSAKESLKILYDEIQNKHEESLVQTKFGNSLDSPSSPKTNTDNVKQLRKEIWIHQDGSRLLHRTSSTYGYCRNTNHNTTTDIIMKLNSQELSKHFLSSFLYIHAKLFSGIGMENFFENSFTLLSEFRLMLRNNSFLFVKYRLLKCIVLNIFSIDFNNKNGNEEIRKELRNHALNIGHLMFGIILERTKEILYELFSFDENQKEIHIIKLNDNNHNNMNLENFQQITKNVAALEFTNDLICLLQCIKVWCDWLAQNMELWRPGEFSINSDLIKNCGIIDPWRNLAFLATTLLNIQDFGDVSSSSSSRTTASDIINVGLEEDDFLVGFVPLQLLPKQNFNNDHGNERQQIELRIKKIIDFCSTILCDSQPPILKINDFGATKIFENCQTTIDDDDLLTEETTLIDNFEKFEEIPEITTNLDDEQRSQFLLDTTKKSMKNSNTNDIDEINELLQRKSELEKRQKIEENYQNRLQTILRSTIVHLYLEVRPKYLVPDTNCFIDFLEKIKILTLLNSDRFTIIIPIVVINELEGLSRGIQTAKNIITFPLGYNVNSLLDEVSKRSKDALLFIRSKTTTLKCVTTKGSVLNSSLFTLEDNDDKDIISNDDKILISALNLCTKTNVEKYKDDVLYIETEVVLLTTDRNLRVKALSRNLSVSRLPEFLNWAGLKS